MMGAANVSHLLIVMLLVKHRLLLLLKLSSILLGLALDGISAAVVVAQARVLRLASTRDLSQFLVGSDLI